MRLLGSTKKLETYNVDKKGVARVSMDCTFPEMRKCLSAAGGQSIEVTRRVARIQEIRVQGSLQAWGPTFLRRINTNSTKNEEMGSTMLQCYGTLFQA